MGIVWGIWDGVTGLAPEPYVAHKQEVSAAEALTYTLCTDIEG